MKDLKLCLTSSDKELSELKQTVQQERDGYQTKVEELEALVCT